MVWVCLVVFVATNGLRTYVEFTAQEESDQAGPVMALVGVSMALLWISWFLMCHYDPHLVALPRGVVWGGLISCLLGSLLFLAALVQLRGVISPGRLIRNGVFAKFRHPMYVGFLFWLAGFPLYTGSLIGLALAVPAMANVLIWRWREELALCRSYPEYAEYKNSTWF